MKGFGRSKGVLDKTALFFQTLTYFLGKEVIKSQFKVVSLGFQLKFEPTPCLEGF